MAKKKELEQKIEELQKLMLGTSGEEPVKVEEPEEQELQESEEDLSEEQEPEIKEPEPDTEEPVEAEKPKKGFKGLKGLKRKKKEPEEVLPEEAPEEAPEDVPDDVADKIIEETSKRMSEDVSREQVEVAPKESTEVVPKEAPVARVKPIAYDPYKGDGPSKAYKYWDYENRFWVLTEDFWTAENLGRGLWGVVWVWRKNGAIHHLMTKKEMQRYLP